VEHESLEDIGGQDDGGGIPRGESRDMTFEDLWFSSLHPCASRDEDEPIACNIPDIKKYAEHK
jgi:hypothetical protein